MRRDRVGHRLRRSARRLKSEVQLVHFIARADLGVLLGIIASFVSLVFSLASWLLGYWPTGLFHGYSAWGTVAGLLGAIVSLFWTAWDLREYKLGTSVLLPETKAVAALRRGDREINFRDVEPSAEELGFAIVSSDVTTDVSMQNQAFDDALMRLPSLPFETGKSRAFRLFSSNEELRGLQLRYLIPRVRNARLVPTLNDRKCGLSMRLSFPPSDCQTYKVGYYDGLITNEAFRSHIYLADKYISGDVESVKRTEVDLSRYFPIQADADAHVRDRFQLAPLHGSALANHIGVTALTLTADNHVLLFRQGDTAVDRGSIVASGSGSLDWKDLRFAQGDLLAAIRFGMAREFTEEASARVAYAKRFKTRSPSESAARAAQDVVVTGFFRWVNRCGKPEFVGAMRAPFTRAELRPDQFEVTQFDFDGVRIFRLADFGVLLRQVEDRVRQSSTLRVGLSSYVALKRLVEIAGYEASPEAAKRDLALLVKRRLALE